MRERYSSCILEYVCVCVINMTLRATIIITIITTTITTANNKNNNNIYIHTP